MPVNQRFFTKEIKVKLFIHIGRKVWHFLSGTEAERLESSTSSSDEVQMMVGLKRERIEVFGFHQHSSGEKEMAV